MESCARLKFSITQLVDFIWNDPYLNTILGCDFIFAFLLKVCGRADGALGGGGLPAETEDELLPDLLPVGA